MPSPSEVIKMAAALMNDSAQDAYTNEKILPYFDMALDELKEVFELNNIPVTNTESAIITLKAGITKLGFGTNPSLPHNLIEIQRAWERPAGVIPWVPMTRRDSIALSQDDHNISQFLYWAWQNQEMRFIESTSDIDIKLQYIQDIFKTPVKLEDVKVDIPVINTKQFLGYRTASLCAQFIAENENRALILNRAAEQAMSRELGIPTKGRQANVTRRQPFMGSSKRRIYY